MVSFDIKNYDSIIFLFHSYTNIIVYSYGGAHGVMVIVVGNGYSDTSSNPGRG